MDRDLLILPPTSAAPTKNPRPSQAPTVRPSYSPTWALGPRLTFEADVPNGLAAISCDNSFESGNLSNYAVLPPFLEELTLSFEYEAYISDTADVAEELKKLQALIVGDLAIQTPLIDQDFEISNMTCNELLLSALDIEKISNQIRRKRSLVTDEEDWKAFLGLVSEPSPKINPDFTCKSTLPNTDCHMVIGYVTAQVPIRRELDQDSIMFVMSKIKQSLDDEKFVSSTVPKLSFIGSREFPDNTEGERPKAGEPWYFDGDGLSVFGILAVVALSLIFLLTMTLLVMKYKRRNSPKGKLDKIQNDALLIGEDELAMTSKNNVFIDPGSLDSVEVVRVNSVSLADQPKDPSGSNAPDYARSKVENGSVKKNLHSSSTSSMHVKPAFQRPTNKKSTLIANGWVEQQRRSKFRVVWKQVLASLVEARRPGEETTLWIQKESIHNGESQLDALHQIPMKWLLDVQFLDYYGDFRMSLSVYGVHEPFIFRTPDEESCREWVATLNSAREASNSKSEMKDAAFPDLINDDGSNGASVDGFARNQSQHTNNSGDIFPDIDDLKTKRTMPSAPPDPSSATQSSERMTIKELRAIAHGAGYDTRGMERADLEKIAAYSVPASARGANPKPFNPFATSHSNPSNSTAGGVASTQSGTSQGTNNTNEEHDQKLHNEPERRKIEEEDRLKKQHEYMQQQKHAESQKVAEAQRAAEAQKLKQQQEAQRAAEVQRLKQQQEAERIAEAQRLKQQQEAQRAAEAQRLKQQQEAQQAAEAQKLKLQQEAQRAAEAQRLKQQQETQRMKEEQESRAKSQQYDAWDKHWKGSTTAHGGDARSWSNGHANTNMFESARFGGHAHSATHIPMPAPSHPAPSHPPPPPPPAFHPRTSDPTSPMNQKYAKQMAGPGDDHVAIKRNILVHWALVPPQYNMLRPIDQLLVNIHTVFPPFGNVAPHEYFSKWKPIKKEDLVLSAAMGNAVDETKLKKAVRKLRVFLHPDRLPKDFDASQTFVCKMLWDISNDAEEELLKQKSDLDWIHN